MFSSTPHASPPPSLELLLASCTTWAQFVIAATACGYHPHGLCNYLTHPLYLAHLDACILARLGPLKNAAGTLLATTTTVGHRSTKRRVTFSTL